MSEYFSIVVSEEGLQKRLACEWLKGHKLFKEAVRTDKNRDIKINKDGKVIGAKPAKNDVEPGIFLDKVNGYKYFRLWNGGTIAIHTAMKFVFYDELKCIYGDRKSTDVMDHINGNKCDNKLSNLRLVSKQFNCYNCDRPFVAITNELPEDAKKYEHQINHDADYDLPGYTSKSNQRLYVEIAPKRYYMVDVIDSSAKVPGFLCSHLSKEKLIPIEF